MSEQITIHIEVYIKTKESEFAHIVYEIEDNDKSMLFSPFLLKGCLNEFQKDGDNILFITSFELTERFKKLRTQQLPNIPSDIQYKINCLIDFIRKKEKLKQYIGIKTIY